jgi:hypothetical protein
VEVPVTAKRLVLFGCACVTAVTLWPAEAAAQRRPVYRHPRTSIYVGVGVGYYRPYYPFYGPYFPYYPAIGFGWSPFFGYPYYADLYPPYPPYYYRGWASARIEVKPNKAQVYLDGYLVGEVDDFDGVFQRLDLPPGEHELSVYLPGYRTYRQKTLFRPGAGYHFKAILEPLPPGATPEPPPQPAPDARDPYGEPGEPPLPPREPGRTRPLPDRPGDRRAPESRDFGTLNIRVQPADAVVVIDGERWDSPEGGSRLILELAAGPHRVEVRKDGFKPYTSTVQIRPGETQALNVSLPPGGVD